MLAKAIQKNIRVSAKKAALVCTLIRGHKVQDAFKILDNVEQKTAAYLKKLLASATANAVNNHGMDGNSLYVFHVVANQGPTYKRTMPRAKGRSDLMRKRSTHLELFVSDNPNEKAERNAKLLKPRAHQHKINSSTPNNQGSIVVESQILDSKGNTK
ncbi:large subunit ribosomal protein L22 [Mycoplasmoides fastidiosum]|uniref:Large ribosomal subunit protein uL22 n=1 Tax=Mycoplasmoides fastidiosum TaxID=92758 RepID=A0ABU0LY56_9BACT|nr:50S ribosomal protein L22 [Mycoplasmoides fastidiosum]MDQ0513629.1 large subunit ribosomal protein L22 [Mycoplasmoides fastidiosum]UUD37951.1 50S ribosomal protein L22 [Mycoplasmoides fastidiosum]